MAIYAVGDIQGCYKALKRLLKQANFNPEVDTLWCCGDMVNRGPESLKVLRYLKSLGKACVCVLGNHDIQLLAYYAGGKKFSGDTLEKVVKADDAMALIEWLRHQPLLHHDESLGWTMVHAGLSPLWSLNIAKKRALQVEKVLQSKDWKKFCKTLQHKIFLQAEPKDKTERLFFSTSVFTRTRFCSEEGLFDWQQKTSIAKNKQVLAWFEHENAKWKEDTRVVFGHWAARGLVQHADALGLDTGCVWGGDLTLAKLEHKEVKYLISLPYL